MKENLMRKKWLLAALVAVPLAVAGGLVYGRSLVGPKADDRVQAGYTCPITGEELPCPNCCPLNRAK
jgi:hypothetical protein